MEVVQIQETQIQFFTVRTSAEEQWAILFLCENLTFFCVKIHWEGQNCIFHQTSNLQF